MTIVAENCIGCGLCAAECPKNAIEFSDQSGFVEPVIDESRCVQCEKCLSVCNKSLPVQTNHNARAFAAWSTDESSRLQSASGGVGYEIARYLLNDGYTCFGIEMDPFNQKAVAYVTSNPCDLEKSRGSKYIPTQMFPAIAQLKHLEKIVLIDVPCHIGAYDAYLKKYGMRDRAILVDVFCAGPCNSLILRKNIAELCAKNQKSADQIKSIKFRSKKRFGWSSNLEIEFLDHSEIYQSSKESDFFKMFYTDAFHPDACYRCEYDRNNSYADIRMGDFWGEAHRNSKEGVSAVLTFTEAGASLIERMSEANIIHIESVSPEVIFADQLDKPQRKTRFYEKVNAELHSEKTLNEIQNGMLKKVVLERKIRMKIKRMLNATKIGICKKIAKKIKK